MSEIEFQNLTVGSKFQIANIDAIWEIVEVPKPGEVKVTRHPDHPLAEKKVYVIFPSYLLREDTKLCE